MAAPEATEAKGGVLQPQRAISAEMHAVDRGAGACLVETCRGVAVTRHEADRPLLRTDEVCAHDQSAAGPVEAACIVVCGVMGAAPIGNGPERAAPLVEEVGKCGTAEAAALINEA